MHVKKTRRTNVEMGLELCDQCVPVRFTATQYRAIKAHAKKQAITVTEAVRAATVAKLKLVSVVVKQGRRAA